uniref:hypothetical protein n=1 Tax=Dorea longicatena TaxID=88431 RepID=UPI001A9B8D95
RSNTEGALYRYQNGISKKRHRRRDEEKLILKRIASKGNKKARNCLKCNSRLLNLKDNVVNTCEVCGQQHLVDFYTNNTIVLTAAERPELRKRPGTPKPEQPKREQNQEAFNKRLAKFREKWKEY